MPQRTQRAQRTPRTALRPGTHLCDLCALCGFSFKPGIYPGAPPKVPCAPGFFPKKKVVDGGLPKMIGELRNVTPACPSPTLRCAKNGAPARGRGTKLPPFTLALLVWLVASLGGCATLGGNSREQETAHRPNILFIYTDDQSPSAVGAMGNSQIKTPNMDSLFRDGVTLANAFVTTPVCSPSRAGLMASRYGSELGITDWINPRSETELGLDPGIVTWPQLLRTAGYETGLSGKWHLGTADRYHPSVFGYDYFMGFRSGGTTPKDPVLEVDGQEQKVEGFTVDIVTDAALKFLRGRDTDRPFLLSVHYREPHAAWLPVRDEDWAPYADLDPEIPNPEFPDLNVEKIKRMTREYMASVTSVDRNLGRLLAELKALGIEKNTVVIFTSDHGYNTGHHGLWYKGNAQWQLNEPPPKRWENIPARQRPNMYDQSLRVATAIRWPAVIRPGTVIQRTVTNLDWFPTLVAIGGASMPTGTVIRGRNFLPLIRGEPLEWDDNFFSEYDMKHGAKTQMRAYRTPEWKYMRDFLHPGREELYDLKADPNEMNNLAASPNPVALLAKKEMSEKLLAHMRKIDDPILP